ncbi:MAG TPA: transporter [Sphingomicrobium sp.]|nr:transporter [Sphingomicrobium sp.]
MRVETALIFAMMVVLSSAAAAAEDPPICPDRPSKSTGPCTVPQGKWQIETGLVDWSRDRSDGVTTTTAIWGNSAIKYGIAPNADIELWLTPLETVSAHGGGVDEHHSSFGDTLLRVKYEITRNDAPVQVALDPFVKIPTANHQIGNGQVEEGLMIPVQIALGKSPFTVALDPELDWLADQDGRGHHAAMIELVNLGWQANKKLTLTTEIWSQYDFDPAGTGKQWSWDGSVAYLVNNNVQLDAGANFGLNRQTPAVELYTGLSVRF